MSKILECASRIYVNLQSHETQLKTVLNI